MPSTMDAAIELTFAERGFLIQRSPKKELTVSVARTWIGSRSARST
ncbi:MAG: hypothetical protein U0263_17490 [Polyangiaceae bacterium]